MIEIESNREAWGKLAEDHYHHYYDKLKKEEHHFNYHIQQELGSLSDKHVIHLQCNIGADTLLLARQAEWVTGVDFVPDNVLYAKKLAEDFDCLNVDFIESDISELVNFHKDTYDVVFSSEGVLGWLPDLMKWAKTIKELLREDGYLYLFDSHPFYLMLDEDKLRDGCFEIKYPYFEKSPDVEDTIGGYASDLKNGVKAYFWMHTMADIINALTAAGMQGDIVNEYSENFFDSGGMSPSKKAGLYEYPHNRNRYPMSFSLRASKRFS